MFVPLGTVLQGNESNPRYYSDPGPGQCPVELQTKVPEDYGKYYNHSLVVHFTFKTLLRHYAKRTLTPRTV